ncbi:MAG: hypothetical protein QM571_03280 [Micrococcaceae bacterium]
MSLDSRAALEALIGALENHLDAIENSTDHDDSGIEAAYYSLAETFDAYEQTLANEHDEVTPFVIFEDEGDVEFKAPIHKAQDKLLIDDDADIDFVERD